MTCTFCAPGQAVLVVGSNDGFGGSTGPGPRACRSRHQPGARRRLLLHARPPRATGEPITLTSTASDPDGTIASYAWDYDNNGTVDSTSANPTARFTTPGNHTVKLTVTDNLGAPTVVLHNIAVGQPPTALVHDLAGGAHRGQRGDLHRDVHGRERVHHGEQLGPGRQRDLRRRPGELRAAGVPPARLLHRLAAVDRQRGHLGHRVPDVRRRARAGRDATERPQDRSEARPLAAPRHRRLRRQEAPAGRVGSRA